MAMGEFSGFIRLLLFQDLQGFTFSLVSLQLVG
jgi:hypothetical protein